MTWSTDGILKFLRGVQATITWDLFFPQINSHQNCMSVNVMIFSHSKYQLEELQENKIVGEYSDY